MAVLDAAVKWLGKQPVLDKVGKTVEQVTRPVVDHQPLKDVLNGDWLGHPVHPLLIVGPIGTWLSAGLLDLVGGEAAQDAADRLVVAGNIAAVPTAAAGIVQWMDTYGAPKRVGTVHAVANTLALALHVASTLARRKGKRDRAVALSLGGLAAVGVGGYLGGHLSYVLGIGVDHTAFHQGPDDWTPTGVRDHDVTEGSLVLGRADDRQILLARHEGRLVAYDDRCTHAGGPLHEGKISDGCVVCPWHGSHLRLADGSVKHSPATTAQPRYEVRVADATIEVKAVAR
jgi:nitrite reductase/ring-hydroxylating ferredoxin subunit/uncharacterized membrane protein